MKKMKLQVGQGKTCSRCGMAGHRRDGGKCTLKSDDEGAMPRPRWAKAGPSVGRGGKHKGLKNRVWRGASRTVQREAWNPPYTRELSPGRKGRKRIDLRAKSDPIELAEGAGAEVRDRLAELGILRQWKGKTCIKCKHR